MQSYEINKHGKIVFPSNCFPDLDFSTFESLEQLDAVVRRDFDAKAPTGTYILERIKTAPASPSRSVTKFMQWYMP